MTLEKAQKALDDLKWDPAERFARRPSAEQDVIRTATSVFAKAKKQYKPGAAKKAAPKTAKKKAPKKDE
ncbi:MAG: hypothetical protein GY875_10220 [Gammaproteobacteria bacterium]|jgi:hypothetical protein|nr:hypothetical protein [Planctomycetaceae bacterium]MCP4766636.1 hypothetical protein [Gammaproteobacteria bacterium]